MQKKRENVATVSSLTLFLCSAKLAHTFSNSNLQHLSTRYVVMV